MKKLVLIPTLLFSSIFCYSQIHKVFRDDMGESVLVTNHYFTDFKEKLPDGTWIYYSVDPKDSTRKDIDNYIKIIGQYKDSLRNGTFHYYSECNYKKGGRKVETTTYNYKNGKLDGNYVSKNCGNEKQSEGFYKDGKKDGYFIRYFKDGQIESIELFKRDTLYEWSNYYKNGLIAVTGKGENNFINGGFTNGEVFKYDTLGNINRKEFYKNGDLLWYIDFFPNGIMLKKGEGIFKCSSIGGKVLPPADCIIFPYNGTITYYDEKGKIAKQEIYQKNKLIETKNK